MFQFILLTVLATVASVIFHLGAAEALLSRWQREARLKRWRLAILIVGFIVVHLLEAAIFAVVMSILIGSGDYGSLQGVDTNDFGTLLYYSAITYTTVGYGDVTPVGDIRIFAAVEALVGMVLVAWTASVIFTVMMRDKSAAQVEQEQAV